MSSFARILAGFWILALASPSGAAGQESAAGEVLVIFRPGRTPETARQALGRHGLGMARHFRHVSRHSGGRVTGLVRHKALGTAKLIERLKADPDVESVEPNYRQRRLSILPDDTHFGKLWGLHNTGQTVNGVAGTSDVDVNFPEAWALARRAPFPEVVVGVLDFGFDITHPDLEANIWSNPGETAGNSIDDDANGYVDDVHGYDFGIGSSVMFDIDGHGTHVAGTTAAVGKNQTGVIGAAFRAKILPLKGSDANGDLFDSTTIEAFEYAIDLKQRGVNIVAINASYGSSSYSTSVYNSIEALRANGIVLCAAAGNESSNNNTLPVYPASYNRSNIIAVAAHTSWNTLATFSNYGSTSVDIAAPGQNIYSTWPESLALSQSSVTVGASNYAAQKLEYAGTTDPAGISGTIHDCGLGGPGDFPPAVAGNIALIERGSFYFSEKVANAMSAGASAAIIYDNTTDQLTTGMWTLDPGTWIPAVRVTRADGLAILSSLPASGTLVNFPDPALIYQFEDGTSMAAPHVTAAVAFAALNFPSETLTQRIARITGNVTTVPAFAGLMTSGGRLNLLKTIDTEGDGLPDWWETEYFGDLSRIAASDEDGDGFSNLDEFRAATDPRDAASHLAFTSFSPIAEGGLAHFDLTFPSVEDQRYLIEWSDSLETGSWLPLGTPLTGTGSPIIARDTDAIHAAPWRFYRLSLLPE